MEDTILVIGKFLAVLGLVAANGFFVAAEFSLVGVRRTRVEELSTGGIQDGQAAATGSASVGATARRV